MSKTSIVVREKKRVRLNSKYKTKRTELMTQFHAATTFRNKLTIHAKIEKLPRDSSKVRLRNRCWKTGRGRGFYRDFGLCRHMIREMSHNCLLPGLYKASW